MLADTLITITGLALLVVGGEVMVRGAGSLAQRVGVSPLAIGLTVVAFGTSAPELAVNVTAAWRGNPAMSFGNIFGSNMANIGLIVALTAMVQPLHIRNVIIRREVPMMILATAVAAVLGLDALISDGPSVYGRGDGVVLLLLFTVFIYYTINDVLEQRARSGGDDDELDPGVTSYGVPLSLVLTFVGIIGLVIGARITVYGAVELARGFGVSEAVIGLTVVAVGTSLPELTASIMATIRGQMDLAIGNAVGSNVFNLLLVLGTSATIRPVPIPEGGGADVAVTVLLSVMLWVASITSYRTIIRAEAFVLLAIYLSYLGQRAFLT